MADTFRTSQSSINDPTPQNYVFNQSPGDQVQSGAAAGSLNGKILAELRVISWLLALQSPGLIHPDDLENFRADPSSLGQRLG